MAIRSMWQPEDFGQMDDLKAKGAIPLFMDITQEEDILKVVG